jgi:Bacterial sugar transferase
MWEISGRTERERGKCPACWVLPAGGWVRMSGFAVARDRNEPRVIRRTGGWARDYLRRAALTDLGCGTLGVFAAVQLRFGSDITGTYIALGLALSAVWLAAMWLVGMVKELGRDRYHGLTVVGTDLCVSPALLDMAGPWTTVRPVAGLTLLHVDHPQLSGFLLMLKDLQPPRVTSVGARLRRWSIDKLPQLVNVVLGLMSLVGRRQAIPDEVARVYRPRPPSPGGQAGADRPVVVEPVLRGVGPARAAIRRVLIVRAGPANFAENGLGAPAGSRAC